MVKLSATELLKEKIAALEIKQAEEGKAFKDELIESYESLKPVNLLKNSVKELTSSTELKKTIFDTLVVLLNGFITKALVTSSKGSSWSKLLTTLVQLGVTNLIASHRDDIFTLAAEWIAKLFHPVADKKVEKGSFCE